MPPPRYTQDDVTGSVNITSIDGMYDELKALYNQSMNYGPLTNLNYIFHTESDSSFSC